MYDSFVRHLVVMATWILGWCLTNVLYVMAVVTHVQKILATFLGELIKVYMRPVMRNSFMPNGISHPYQIHEPISNLRVLG